MQPNNPASASAVINYFQFSAYGNIDFNDSLNIKTGKKYTKVLQGNTVWGFIANSDGVLKGIPYFKGDVFKPAGWKGPAKYARGSIFDTNTNWFSWTGPNYL